VTRAQGPLDTLRRAFVAGDDAAAQSPDCPGAGEIWDTAHAALEPNRAREIVRHVGTCATCAADWHLALSGDARPAARDEPARASTTSATWIRLAGAAAVVAGIAWLGVWTARDREVVAPTFREPPEIVAIRALMPEDAPLSRSAAILRWTPAGEGARYTVEISADDLTPLHTAHGVMASELQLPAEVVSRIQPGSTIVWRVEARLADGSRVRSGAIVHRVE
jgi:hypothetical protein